ncbi:hypothetical protein DMA11_01885 [Marinilabiliaceae bacterium JC017]|nr:hypothetical protein DMA11_01885 [Marinilabiliaceae bacterium JC017]
MSFIAKLTLDSQDEINVLSCDYGVKQQTDVNGIPSQRPLGGGYIHMVIESDGNTDFFDWVVSPTKKKNGNITFFKRDAHSRLKRLNFTDAYCIEYHEYFEAQNAKPMTTKLTLSAREIQLENIPFSNNWPVLEG